MKRSQCLLAILVLPLCSAPVSAGERSVYFNLGLGLADARYEGETKVIMDALEDVPGVSHGAVSIDLTLYFRISSAALIGPTINGIGDRFEDSTGDLQLNQYLFGCSYRYYVSRKIGDGFFLRADAGLAKALIASSFGSDVTSDNGFGILLGAGYSFPIFGTHSMSINVEFTSKSIEDEAIGGFSAGGAIMF